MLNVRGDSMINAGIHDGDQIIVQQQQDALNGEIVVAMVDDDHEVTVKRFFKESDYIRLQPENDLLEPIIAKNVTLLGKSLDYLERCTNKKHLTDFSVRCFFID